MRRFDGVVFDFHGTLVHPSEVGHSYPRLLSGLGYLVDDLALETWVESFDGAAHFEHSVDEPSYRRWSMQRLATLAEKAGVPAGDERARVVAELDRWGQGAVVAFAEAADVVRGLRAGGVRVGVCSNWGWHLDPFLEQAGLASLVDVAVTSARVGARKPHPEIYRHTSTALGLPADRCLFVGDNFHADVAGPLRAGWAAAHVWRPGRPGGTDADPPALPPGAAYRISDLTGVLDIVWS